MDLNAIKTIARLELIINIRNRWILVFAVVFGTLVMAISYFGLATAGAVGFQGFARTSASLMNLVLYVVPLVSLMMGTLSLTNDKSTGEMVFSQPITRTELLVGKIGGLFAAIVVATLLGFGVAGLVIAVKAGTEGVLRYPLLVSLSLALALVFLCLSAAAVIVCRRKPMAFGLALFIWFFYVLFYDLLVIGGTFLLPERAANTFLFVSLFGNPVAIVRVASLIALNGQEIFGPAGAALIRFLGGSGPSVAFLLGALSLWVLVPLLLARRWLERQDI